MDAFLPIKILEDAVIKNAFEDNFKAATEDYEISFHLLEDILPEKEQ